VPWGPQSVLASAVSSSRQLLLWLVGLL
jgi:hypothetical protein